MSGFMYTRQDLEDAAKALLTAQRPGTEWAELTEAERGNMEADAEAVLEAVGGAERGNLR